MQKKLGKQVFQRRVPLVKRGITAGASLMALWIVTLYAIIIGIWWKRLHEYFVDRGTTGGISHGGNRLAAVALTGHIVTVPIPRSRLAGCSCRSPLAHFFIHHGDSSRREVHPFTTITHLASQDAVTEPESDELVVQFLFRKIRASSYVQEDARPSPKSLGSFSKYTSGLSRGAEWTEKLAGPLDRKLEEQSHVYSEDQNQALQQSWDLDLRLEGPYFSPADPSHYDTVVCLVAGTGISGALAIAGAFLTLQKSQQSKPQKTSHVRPTWQKCVIVWSIRESDFVELPMLGQHQALEMQLCLTGPGRPRQDMRETISKIREVTAAVSGVWAYISGPKGFIESAKTACRSTPNKLLDRL
ncbi:MAG: hypothetical protein Q9222_000468 [Ikaeria aurantiellina]